MADNHTPEARSYNMSQIRSKNTKPEELVRKWLFAEGFRYKKNVRGLPGCPDVVLPMYHTVIFVNGCFWHMHECGMFRWPASNRGYWEKKLLGNANRDHINYKKLEELGWNTLVVWECELNRGMFESTMTNLKQEITKGKAEHE